MKGLNLVQRVALLAALFAAVLPGFVAGAFAAGAPTVALKVTPDPAPGAAVTVKATITITDGSALQSVSWKQTSGVTVNASGTTTDTITLTVPDRKTLRNQLITALEEPGLPDSAIPDYVPTRAANFYGGLQERFQVVGVSNHALSDATSFRFTLTIVTSSGTYNVPASFSASIPWSTSVGQRNVAINLPVILHAPQQASYNWTLTAPSGSKTTLVDATSQNPEFTPDVAGSYKLSVTNLATNAAVNFTVYAGTWKGIIVGQDANGRPTTDPSCKSCHVGQTEVFTPWAQSGHAEILTQNVTAPGASHYGESCWECHTVGYTGTALNNNGLADQSDFAGFEKDFGHMTKGDPLNWTKILTSYPATARLTNIQCENCHGPQNSDAHGTSVGSDPGARVSLSSDVCGSCHGEPARHGRFQQWQLSGHANFETAINEGTNAGCAKCHSAQGFMQWGDKGYASTATINVTWTADNVQPQTCVVCHDPHAEGTTSSAGTNAQMRVQGNTPVLDAGFAATNVGKAAECMTCHNSRRGLRDEQHFTAAGNAPHEGPQADILLGQNLYFVKVGTRGYHGMLADSCVTCHMRKSSAPSTISMANQTNHTFYADPAICKQCHSEITADAVQGRVVEKLVTLKSNIEAVYKSSMQAQIRAGNSIDFGGGTVARNASDISGVTFESSHGQQALTVALGSKTAADVQLGSIKVVRPGGSSTALPAAVDPALIKAGWNYFMVENDKSEGVHNPAFVNSALDLSIYATNALASSLGGTATATTPAGNSAAAIGGGLGNGAGAVSCTSSYVYWAEIAGHMPGSEGSQWRTDIITRNLSSHDATLKFFLHQSDGTMLTGNGAVVASGQKAFEDIVNATLGGGNNLGSLEICSDQPLLVNGRIFNAATSGTFGQNLDGAVADVGYSTGQTVSLIGLRQKSDSFRTNISVTNSGTTEAQVSITLYDATGTSIKTYTLTVPAGQVVQDTEPFKNRANAPNLDWGFATVTVLKGSNIHTSASLADNKTNDPTTITAKQ